MDFLDTEHGPIAAVQLNHPTNLPVYKKVHNYENHPKEGPPIVILSGGSGARALSETLIRYTHNSSHVLPMFDDGGSSRELRHKLGMPPPGDLRNRLMALSDMSKSGNPAVSRLFRTRLSAEGSPDQLNRELQGFLSEDHPQMATVERRYRRIIINHLERFRREKPDDFDLRGGSIGNFVIAGAYLSVGDLESVIFEFSALAAVRGQVFPVCTGGSYLLKAELKDGSECIGQSIITGSKHAPIHRLSIVEMQEGKPVEAQPPLNPLAAEAIRTSSLITYTMGSLYTSILSNLLVAGMGQVIRETRRPKVYVANLIRDRETLEMTVSMMLNELHRHLQRSDPVPGEVKDYIHYVLVNTHGNTADGGRVPVDLEAIRALGVEPIVLPLEDTSAPRSGIHNSELVAAVLLSLC